MYITIVTLTKFGSFSVPIQSGKVQLIPKFETFRRLILEQICASVIIARGSMNFPFISRFLDPRSIYFRELRPFEILK